jgi:hypothetical protein
VSIQDFIVATPTNNKDNTGKLYKSLLECSNNAFGNFRSKAVNEATV